MAIVCDRVVVRECVAWLVTNDPAWFAGEDLDLVVKRAARRIGRAVALVEGRVAEPLHPFVSGLHIARVAIALLLASRRDVRRDWLVEAVLRAVEEEAGRLARFVDAEYARLACQTAQ